jgi:hypothetical protein
MMPATALTAAHQMDARCDDPLRVCRPRMTAFESHQTRRQPTISPALALPQRREDQPFEASPAGLRPAEVPSLYDRHERLGKACVLAGVGQLLRKAEP